MSYNNRKHKYDDDSYHQDHSERSRNNSRRISRNFDDQLDPNNSILHTVSEKINNESKRIADLKKNTEMLRKKLFPPILLIYIFSIFPRYLVTVYVSVCMCFLWKH